jgi:hypothetical protein
MWRTTATSWRHRRRQKTNSFAFACTSGASGAPCLVVVADRLRGTQGNNIWQMALPREGAVTGNAFTVTAMNGMRQTPRNEIPNCPWRLRGPGLAAACGQ